MIRLAVIGSSGSIGTQVLNVVRRYPDRFCVKALTVNKSVETLAAQVREFKPSYAGIADEGLFDKAAILSARVAFGPTVIEEAASLVDVDVVVVACVGMRGLRAVLAAARSGKRIALANKESLVAGGRIVTEAVKKGGATLLPVDSEHSAVWQCLSAGRRDDLRRIILTASGGPFRLATAEELRAVTPEQAVRHPNWSMGRKISVDSATMMNKGLEIIEARWLFGTEQIDYVIHPESVVHSMVEFIDGSVIAQLACPNMELPIQLALTYPERADTAQPPLKLNRPLTFFEPDEARFPAPRIAGDCMKKGGNAPAAMNAANEAAVELFLNRKIRFTDIVPLVERAVDSLDFIETPGLEEVEATHRETIERLMRDYINFGAGI